VVGIGILPVDLVLVVAGGVVDRPICMLPCLYWSYLLQLLSLRSDNHCEIVCCRVRVMPEVMQLMLMLIVVSTYWTVVKRGSCCVVDDKHDGESNVAAVAVMVDWFLISRSSNSTSDSDSIIAGKSAPTARLSVQMVPLQDI